jgi:hypothetical protein
MIPYCINSCPSGITGYDCNKIKRLRTNNYITFGCGNKGKQHTPYIPGFKAVVSGLIDYLIQAVVIPAPNEVRDKLRRSCLR